MSDRRKHNTKVQHEKKRAISVALSPTSPEFSAYREGENRRQKQLADFGAQVDRVVEAVVRWSLDNPSAKEQPYFLSLQERLAKLGEIIARLVQRKSISTDSQEWFPTLAEARSLLKEAGQSDEVLAGLPNELPDLTSAQNSGKTTKGDERQAKQVEKDKREMKRLLEGPMPKSVRDLFLLSDNQRQVATLSFGYKWPIARVARAMGKDRKTIRETLTRIKSHVQQCAKNTRSAKMVTSDAQRCEVEDELIRKIDKDKEEQRKKLTERD